MEFLQKNASNFFKSLFSLICFSFQIAYFLQETHDFLVVSHKSEEPNLTILEVSDQFCLINLFNVTFFDAFGISLPHLLWT
jgi:hypothetical protein